MEITETGMLRGASRMLPRHVSSAITEHALSSIFDIEIRVQGRKIPSHLMREVDTQEQIKEQNT